MLVSQFGVAGRTAHADEVCCRLGILNNAEEKTWNALFFNSYTYNPDSKDMLTVEPERREATN